MGKACALDIHKDSVFACILDEQGKKLLEKRCGTFTPDLTALRDALIEQGRGRIAMESTGICWMPVWHVLESDFSLKPVNPHFIKQLPGRKSDVKDTQRIATLLHKGMMRGSFVPSPVILELRVYFRKYGKLKQQVTRVLTVMNSISIKSGIRASSCPSSIGQEFPEYR